MKKFTPQIKKLQKAINIHFGKKILINKSQFYSDKTDSIVETIVIKQAVWDKKKQKIKNVELFSSPSDVQIVLFLRDYWFRLNGWEIPTDNEYWENIKKKKELVI